MNKQSDEIKRLANSDIELSITKKKRAIARLAFYLVFTWSFMHKNKQLLAS